MTAGSQPTDTVDTLADHGRSPAERTRRRRGRRGGRKRRSRAIRQASPSGDRVAAIDLGTNNCRLLVAQPAPAGFEVVDAFSRIVRLGEGLDDQGCFSEAAMRRTVAALKVCAKKINQDGVRHVRAVATHACRTALNCGAFTERIRAATGLELEVISPEEEARLALAGSAPLLDPETPHAVVFDIGGGSTEIMWLRLDQGCCPQLVDTLSLPIGVAGLSAQAGPGPYSAATYEHMVETAAAQLAPFERRWQISQAIRENRVQMLGTSGTVTTVAGIEMGLCRYERAQVDGTDLAFPAIERIAADLAARGRGARADHPCIGNQRCDFVVPGCAILEAICRTWPVGRLRVADRGVREGILFELTCSGLVPSALASSL